MAHPTAILLISCSDQRGIVTRLSIFVCEQGGNIVDSDHHSDIQAGRFLGRIEWEDEGSPADRERLRQEVAAVASPMGGQWELHFFRCGATGCPLVQQAGTLPAAPAPPRADLWEQDDGVRIKG